MIDGKNFFDRPVKNDKVTYENMRKISPGQGDYKMIAVDLSKQQTLDADPKAIQQINFTANLNEANTRFISFLKKAKKLFLNFRKEP